jgi:diadenylate cyclase
MPSFIQSILDILQIIILAIPIYFLLKFLRPRKGYRMLIGMLIVFILLGLISRLFDLSELSWVLEHAISLLPMSLIIIFQQDLRLGLAEIAGRHSGQLKASNTEVKEELLSAVETLMRRKIGALIAIERNVQLDEFIGTTGVKLDCEILDDLIVSLFFPNSPLHDGGMIIRNGRICAASCVFPVSTIQVGRRFGTRHRAAIGLSEHSDALIIIVSEELGILSVAYNGQIYRGLKIAELKEVLDVAALESSKVDEAISTMGSQNEIDKASAFSRNNTQEKDLLADAIGKLDKEIR